MSRMSVPAAIACRVLLAGVLLYAGIAKAGDPAGSIRAVKAYQILSSGLAEAVGAALPLVEIAVGVLLLVGVATRAAAAIAALLLIAFAGAIGSVWARGLRIDCGCFGGGGELGPGESPVYHLEILRGVVLLAAALFLIIRPRTPVSVDSRMLVRKD